MQIGELFFSLGFKSKGTGEAKAFESSIIDSKSATDALAEALDQLVFLLEKVAIKMGAVTRAEIDAHKAAGNIGGLVDAHGNPISSISNLSTMKKEDAGTKAVTAATKVGNAEKHKSAGILTILHQRMTKALGAMNALRVETIAGALGLVYFTDKAAKAAVHIDKISALTGLSRDGIQRMGDAVAQTGGSVDDMAGAVRTLQQQSMDIMMGRGGNVGVYGLLGLNPHEDPLVLLNKLSAKLKSMPAAYGANLARELGLSDDMIYFLKNTQNIKPPREETIVTKKELDRLKEFNFYFNRVWEQGKRVLQRLAAFLLPITNEIVYFFDRVGTLVGKAITAIEPYMEKINKWLGPLKVMGAVLFAALFPVTAAFVMLGLVLEDISSYLAGDDSVTGRLIKQLTDVNSLIDGIIKSLYFLANVATLGIFSDQLAAAQYNTQKGFGVIDRTGSGFATPEARARWDQYMREMSGAGAAGINAGTQGAQNNVTVNVQGIVTNTAEMEKAAHLGVVNAYYQMGVPEGLGIKRGGY